MGIVEFFILVVVAVVFGSLAIVAINKLSPDHPKLAEYIIWFVVFLIIIVALANATGLTGYDPKIPRIH